MNSELVSLKRALNMKLPLRQTAFLFGIRKSGKSTYLKAQFPDSRYYDLLQTELFFRLNFRPSLLREEILQLSVEDLSKPIIIDEVQKIPALLDEIHWLIENTTAYFILCGSSVRKLRTSAVNLLGGRAWTYYLRPLSFLEIADFDLLQAFNRGLIPEHYLSKQYRRFLKAYVQDYLKEEIRAEGLVRNLANFSRFLDSAAFSNSESLNYSNIARDCSIDSKTVKEYYQILVDTLVGHLIYPYSDHATREQVINSMPKFYFADLGLANYLAKRQINILKGSEAGKSFEQFIFLELKAALDSADYDIPIQYWKSKGNQEVDFIVADLKLAIEVKLSEKVDREDLESLFRFQDLYPSFRTIVLSRDSRSRKIETPRGVVEIWPWQKFFREELKRLIQVRCS